jgi:hypothetical protein
LTPLRPCVTDREASTDAEHARFLRQSPSPPMPRSANNPLPLDEEPRSPALEALVTALSGEDRVVIRARRDNFEGCVTFIIAARGIPGARVFVESLLRIEREVGHDEGVWMEVAPRWSEKPGCDFETFPDWTFFDLDLRGSGDVPPDDDLLREVTAAVRRKQYSPAGNYWKIHTDPDRDAPSAADESDIDPDLLPVVVALRGPHVVVPFVPRDHPYDGDLLYVATHDIGGIRRFVTGLKCLYDVMGFQKDGVNIDVELEWQECAVPHCDFELWPRWLFFQVRLSSWSEISKDERRALLQRVARALRPGAMLN